MKTHNLTNMYCIQVCVCECFWKNKSKMVDRVQSAMPPGMDKERLQTKCLIKGSTRWLMRVGLRSKMVDHNVSLIGGCSRH